MKFIYIYIYRLFPHSLVGGRDHPYSWAPTKGLGGCRTILPVPNSVLLLF